VGEFMSKLQRYGIPGGTGVLALMPLPLTEPAGGA